MPWRKCSVSGERRSLKARMDCYLFSCNKRTKLVRFHFFCIDDRGTRIVVLFFCVNTQQLPVFVIVFVLVFCWNGECSSRHTARREKEGNLTTWWSNKVQYSNCKCTVPYHNVAIQSSKENAEALESKTNWCEKVKRTSKKMPPHKSLRIISVFNWFMISVIRNNMSIQFKNVKNAYRSWSFHNGIYYTFNMYNIYTK